MLVKTTIDSYMTLVLALAQHCGEDCRISAPAPILQPNVSEMQNPRVQRAFQGLALQGRTMARTTFLAKVRVLWRTIAQNPSTVRLWHCW
jgi:hypothetical protein